MNRHGILMVGFAAAVGAVLPIALAQEKPEAVAEQAAESWLRVVDTGGYGESWQKASDYFKSKVTQAQWEEMLGTVRSPLGKVNSRKLAKAEHVTELPNAPKGDYVVLQFHTSFANLPSATETVVPVLEKDGQWRVSGYFVKKD